MIRTLLGTIILTLIASTALGETIGTKDGLTIDYQPNSRDTTSHLTALKLDGRDVPLLDEHAVFRIRDAATGGALKPVRASIALMANGHMAIEAHDVLDLGLYGEISSNDEDRLVISGTLVDSSKKDRCIDLWVGLPLRQKGVKLESKLTTLPDKPKPARAQKRDADLDVSDPTDNARYPIFSASGSVGGLSLAVPPTMPTRFTGALDANGLGIIIRIGISPHTSPPSQTTFQVILYRHDPAWGFRSALARYYEFYREPFFTRRVKKFGAWTSQNPSQLREKDLYAYHEAGFATWRTPGGTESGINVKPSLELRDEGSICHSLEQFEKLCELEEDQRVGIYALPYTIVGQRQLLQLPELPKSYDEAMKVLDNWSATQPILFDGPPQALSFRNSDELKSIIRNSGIHDEQHRLAIVPRPYRGPTLTFPQNPNPRLFDDQPDRMTIAKYTLDYYLPMMFGSKWVDGCYLDSLGRWCSFYNYRTDHFRYTKLPLTYAGSPPQPCIWNLQSHAEYLWELSSRLHKQNKIFIANGVHP
ncbi:MAG TPA: hypothetical protein VL282_07545, partial [Tepidisphaeraceae bacterium]|nr:hypothetical protein [Tepidisphaeraceae bacterium]